MRVAALFPAAADIVAALGAADRLVAMTHACIQPHGVPLVPRITRNRIVALEPAAIDREVREVSGTGAPLFDLDDARLAATAPDVIFAQAVCDVCAVRAEDVAAVANRLSPPPRLVTLSASSVEGVLRDVVTVGEALGISVEAEELALGLRGRLRRVHERLELAGAPRPRAAVIEWTDPLFAAGHWVPDMVHRAGGIEVLGTEGIASRRMEVSDVRASRPEVIVIAPCGVGLADASREGLALLQRSDWTWAGDVPAWSIDANRLTSTPGPGVVHGVEVLARILHPDLFGPPSGSAAQALRPAH